MGDDLDLSVEKQQDLLEAYERLADVLIVLANVTSGDLDTRLPLDLPPSHPLGALNQGINDMVEALVASKTESESYQRQLEDRLAMIEKQRIAIRELSTPIIEVWDRVICLPVIGVVDSARGAEMTERLLHAVTERRAKRVIVDVTGIDVMDTRTVDHFIRMARAVELLGADCVLTGLSPALAQTIVALGVEIRGIRTFQTLREAIRNFATRVDGANGRGGVVR
jgi:rsbT co-antagonist protein RsbR